MSVTLKTFISTSERVLLWALVNYDVANSVHQIINSSYTPLEKTNRIVNQMDFIFEIRQALLGMPQQGGKIALTDVARAYLSTLLDLVKSELLSPELKATFFRDRDSLQLKFGDAVQGFLVPTTGKIDAS